MESPPHYYAFAPPSGPHLVGDEALPLQLWKLRNRGKARVTDGSVRISPSNIPYTTTLAQLTSSSDSHHRHFVNADASIESGYGGETRLILHISEY